MSLQGVRRKFKYVTGDTVTHNLLPVWQFISPQCFEQELEFWGSQAAGWASQVALVVKNPPANAVEKRDAGSLPGSGRSPGGGNGNSFWYSCLKNSLDRGAWGRGGYDKASNTTEELSTPTICIRYCGTFVTAEKPTLAHRYHTNPVVSARLCPQCCASFGF